VNLNRQSAPIIPTRLEKDPTGQQGRRLRAKADIKRRISQARDPVLSMLESIPVERREVNKIVSIFTGNKVVYKYDIDALRLTQISSEIDALISQILELDQLGRPYRWFFDDYLSGAYQEGATKSAARMQALAEGVGLDFEAAQLEIGEILRSQAYQRRFELVSARAFEDMKGFAGQAATDLGRILGDGVLTGQSPRIIARDIRRKFDQIEGYRALRIARTEVNTAFTDARSDQTKDARDRLGLEVKVMHLSALVQNTRKHHAFRHGGLFTPEDQDQWWSEGTNRISCLCSTVEILYLNGEPVQKDLIAKQKKRGKDFFNS
jgi:SPP1 gp7 family putative phage head morphogenesis protein